MSPRLPGPRCQTCENRDHDVHTHHDFSTPTLLTVSLITLAFKTSVLPNTPSYEALNTLLNNTTDSAESTNNPTTFTTWSPCLSDPKTIVIITTEREICSSPSSPIFGPVLPFLETLPKVLHALLNPSIISLSPPCPDHKVSSDVIILRAPNPTVASAIGKRFGWDPRRSSLTSRMDLGTGVTFSLPGDLIRDFWAWAELPGEAVSPNSSPGSADYGGLRLKSRNVDADEKRDTRHKETEKEREHENEDEEEETLIMIFQWSSRSNAERFKDAYQKSYGLKNPSQSNYRNGELLAPDFWDAHVARPVRELKQVGAKAEMYRVELRGVEQRIAVGKSEEASRERNGSRKLSTMATEIGERVSGLWRQ